MSKSYSSSTAAAVLLPMTFDVQGDYDDDLRITTSNAYITFVQSLGEAVSQPTS